MSLLHVSRSHSAFCAAHNAQRIATEAGSSRQEAGSEKREAQIGTMPALLTPTTAAMQFSTVSTVCARSAAVRGKREAASGTTSVPSTLQTLRAPLTPVERCRIVSKEDAKGCFIEHDDILVDMIHDVQCHKHLCPEHEHKVSSSCDEESDVASESAMQTHADDHTRLEMMFYEMHAMSRGPCGLHWRHPHARFANMYVLSRAADGKQHWSTSSSAMFDGNAIVRKSSDESSSGNSDRGHDHYDDSAMVSNPATLESEATQQSLSANGNAAHRNTDGPSGAFDSDGSQQQWCKRQKMEANTSMELAYRSQEKDRHIAALSTLLEKHLLALATARNALVAERKQHAEACKSARIALAKCKQEALKERQRLRTAMQDAAAEHARECAARDRDARLILVRILKAKARLQVRS